MATMTLSVPNNDISIFKLIVQRMGWILEHETEEQQPVFSDAEEQAAKQRALKMDYFIDKFKTDEITEEEIIAECEAVRQELYEARQQAC
jgi:hypothetical protein